MTQGFVPGDATRKGIKIAGIAGQPVVAAEAGKVVYSGSGLIGYGRLIIIKHNRDYLSAYGYNRRILVREGDQVTRGERIAEMGNTSGNAPMLHFEIRRRGKPVDPVKILPPR
ncbi:MAG: peptidoglycan DD-metalloendopeptidase family protein [Chromatiales bacterium]